MKDNTDQQVAEYRTRAASIHASLEGIHRQSEQLNIGVFSWIGSAPWYYAAKHDLFADHGLKVSVKSYPSHTILLEDLLRGQIQAANLTLDLAMRVAENDPRFLILPPYVLSQGADALVAREGITSIKDLKGKKVGVERRGIGHFFVSYILLESGMSQDDVEIVDVLAHEAGALLISGEIDAAVLWDPWLLEVSKLKSLHVLASSKEYPVLLDALLVRKSFYDNHTEVFTDMVNTWLEAAEKVKKSEGNTEVALYLDMTSEEFTQSLVSLAFHAEDTDEMYSVRNVISRHFQREVENAKKTHKPISPDVMKWGTEFHLTLLEDRNRMEAYKRAISEDVASDDTVLDLGTGTGILARLAVDAGAKKVYAIEGNSFIASLAEESFSVEPYASRITLIKGYSMDVQLPEPVDLIISEIIGNVGDNEGMTPILNDARKRFLKKEGRMLPKTVETFLVPVYVPEIDRLNPSQEQIPYGYKDAFIDTAFHISKPQSLQKLQFDGADKDAYESDLKFVCNEKAKFHGFKAYFRAQLSSSVELSIETLQHIKDNREGSWRHAFFPIDKTLELELGDVIEVKFTAGETDMAKLTKEYHLEGIVKREGKEAENFKGLID